MTEERKNGVVHKPESIEDGLRKQTRTKRIELLMGDSTLSIQSISIVHPSRKMLEQRILFVSVLIISLPYVWSQSSHDTDVIENQCPTNASINLTGGTLDESSGFMVKNGYVFPPESRWIQDDEIFGCVCYNRPKCLPVYCPIGTSMYHQTDKDCYREFNSSEDDESIDVTVPVVYSVDLPIRSVEVNDHNIHAEYSYGICRWMGKMVVVAKFLEDGIYARRNGSVYIPEKNISAMYNFDRYCLCDSTEFYTYSLDCARSGIVHTVIESFVKEHGNTTQGTTMISHVGMIISIPFLLVTFVIYTILPELKNIHGLTLRGYVGCLLVGYTTLAVIQTTGPISDVPCLIFAFTIYFSFLASFFWLNVMCFDIWWTFGGFRSLQRNVDKQDVKKILMYSTYAMGCAILFTGICMIMNFVPGIPDNFIRPEFGMESTCWFKTDKAKALYFYGPMGVTITCNIFFFISTAVKIIRHKKNTAQHLQGTDSKRHDDNKQWFNLYLKLFIVMGINWSMEIAAWLFEDLKHIWYLTDLGNALQGLIIFIIFICKKNIKRLLVKRFGCHAPKFLSRDSAITTLPSSTAQTAMTSASEHQ